MSSPLFDPRFEQARFVLQPDSLVPRQRHTPVKLQRAFDFRMFWALKHPAAKSEFHSFAEYLHAGLLEGDPKVTSFVPQPYRLRVHGRYYTPDCYVLTNGHRQVLEIKPKGIFDDSLRVPLEHYFLLHNIEFKVISNESILARQREAENWIEIVHTLFAARDINTHANELGLLRLLQDHREDGLEVREIVDPGDRERTYSDEIALLRLMHRGLVCTDLTTAVFDYDCVIRPCT
ncbi:Tn7 transposase TnsA N-terminal domain-containing protein [Microbulbifer epialgicus]|uniref:Tn7 transposase TnsA N-terminal domain-containing protein n=1 Tax=Microbulbifer epialgicus TaxID=393907 RepID=A0ABV4P468_9GAMM